MKPNHKLTNNLKHFPHQLKTYMMIKIYSNILKAGTAIRISWTIEINIILLNFDKLNKLKIEIEFF